MECLKPKRGVNDDMCARECVCMCVCELEDVPAVNSYRPFVYCIDQFEERSSSDHLSNFDSQGRPIEASIVRLPQLVGLCTEM
jgi:hypothetical protein